MHRGVAALDLATTDLAKLLLNVLSDMDVPAHRPIHVETSSVLAEVDGPKVERIVENLIINAIRYTPQGTRIEVRAQPAEGGFVLSVDDEGPGVPDGEKDSIFEAFQTGSTSRPHSPGTGIGLSLVARFADLHGGRCWVSDRPGGGSSFAVFLPSGKPEPLHSDTGAA